MSGDLKQTSPLEVDEHKSALLSNAGAIAAVASAIEGTLGPKGLNCMLVDRFGEVTISNDGYAILDRMEVSHPAGRLLVETAKAQDTEVGDGTTTACLLASTLIAEGAGHILGGVPAVKIVEGIRAGIREAIEALRSKSKPLEDFDDSLLNQAALIAGRGSEEIARLVVEGARIAGKKRLAQRGFRLADWVVAKEGTESEVFCGITLEKSPVNRHMPRSLEPARILVVDDALSPLEVEAEALATEAGFCRYQELQESFRRGLARLVEDKINVVIAGRGVSETAEQILTEAGIMLLRRVPSRDLAKVAEHTGACPVKRGWLSGNDTVLGNVVGSARKVDYDEKLDYLRISGGKGKRVATMLVGAGTPEVKAENSRIAQDAACAVQQAVLGGVVAGGGAAEMGIIPQVERLRAKLSGMAVYGVDCVIAALRRPLSQIVSNAGFNPLEKVEQIRAAGNAGKKAIGIDCDSGKVCDMLKLGIVDATNVKVAALQAGAEMADAVLRINTIIRKRDESCPQGSGVEKGSR